MYYSNYDASLDARYHTETRTDTDFRPLLDGCVTKGFDLFGIDFVAVIDLAFDRKTLRARASNGCRFPK